MQEFSPTAVSRELITEILDIARRSPSGVNTQPWLVSVLMDASGQSLFCGAPSVIGFSIHRDLGLGSQLDCGMYVASVQMAAQARGLACDIRLDWGGDRQAVEAALRIAADEILVCTMGIGHAASAAAANDSHEAGDTGLQFHWLE
jgi:hypothetical protein